MSLAEEEEKQKAAHILPRSSETVRMLGSRIHCLHPPTKYSQFRVLCQQGAFSVKQLKFGVSLKCSNFSIMTLNLIYLSSQEYCIGNKYFCHEIVPKTCSIIQKFFLLQSKGFFLWAQSLTCKQLPERGSSSQGNVLHKCLTLAVFCETELR